MRATRSRFSTRWARIPLVLALLAVVACSEKKGGDDEPSNEGLATTSAPEQECVADSVVECAPEGTSIDDLLPAKPVKAEGEPIKIGMINTVTGPTNTFPELTLGTEAGVRWINAELGGLDGHPIELHTCDTAFSAPGSSACAQEMVQAEVVAVLDGIDIFDDAVAVLEANGIPLLGNIPVGFATVSSPISFQLGGGSWSMDLAFAYHITETLKAERVSIMYSDYGPIADGAMWAQRALLGSGIAEADVNMVPMPVIAEDILTPLTAANESDPDAIIVLVTGTGCNAAIEAAHDIGVEAQLYFAGSCIDSAVVEAVGIDKMEGYIFTTSTPVGDMPDMLLYTEVADRYGEGLEVGSAAVMAFKALLNLYDQLVEVGADDLTRESLLESLRSARDHRSYLGAPYTCDGLQMGGELPAICSPFEILATVTDGELKQISDWIDIAAFVEETGAGG